MHSLENDTQIQTKIGKVYTRFQTKTAQKTIPLLGRHIPIREYPGENMNNQAKFRQKCAAEVFKP